TTHWSGVMTCGPPLVDLHWHSDVGRIETALSTVDIETLVLPPPLAVGHREMTRVELHVLVNLLYGLAMLEPPTPWTLVKDYTTGVVAALAAIGVDELLRGASEPGSAVSSSL